MNEQEWIKAHVAKICLAQKELDAQLLDLSSDQIRLMCGEMSAEAMRCVKAVLKNRAAAIRQQD